MKNSLGIEINLEKRPWKHDSVILTVLCAIAYFFGRYKYPIRTIFRIALIVSVTYALIHFTGLSIEFQLKGHNLFMIK